MQNFRQTDEQTMQSQNTVILKNLFNIIFRDSIFFRGANNNQYFFSKSQNVILFGYQQIVLNRQLKMLKKYKIKEGNIVLLDKSYEFFLNYPLKVELWKFDRFLNCRVHQIIHKVNCINFEDCCDYYKLREIGINLDENILVFQIYNDVLFFYKCHTGFWNLEQTIDSTNYHQMQHIRFNQSNDIIIAYQVGDSLYIDKLKFIEYYLTIINKNQYGIWQTTHHIQESLNPFQFIDNQYFLLFQYDKYIQALSEISILDHKVQVKKKFNCGDYLLYANYCDPPLIEIKSKNLLLLGNGYFFSLKQSNLFLQLLQLYNFDQVCCAKNSEFLFCKLSNAVCRKSQVYSIYVQ